MKKKLLLVIGIIMTACILSQQYVFKINCNYGDTIEAVMSENIEGDLNEDGTVDSLDLSILSLALIRDIDLSEYQQLIADVDNDRNVTLADLARYQQYLAKKVLYLNQTSNERKIKVYAFGDSITQGYKSSPSGESYSDYGGYVGLCDTYNANCQTVNCGNATGGFVHKGNNGKNGCEILRDTIITDADVITIAYGINDYGQNEELGDENSTVNDGTLSGNLRYMIETAIEKAPDASIVVISPLNMWKYTRSGTELLKENEYALGTINNKGYNLNDVCQMLEYWCKYYNIIFIDWSHHNPVVNLENIKSAFDDGVHPNDVTYAKLYRAYSKTIPLI